MAFNIGELFGTLTITGAGKAVADLDAVSTGFTETGAAAKRAGASVDSSSAALVGSGRAAGLASSGAAKLRAAQLSAVAATERYNALLNDESASMGRLAAAEASVIRANERVTATSAAMTGAQRESAVASKGFMTSLSPMMKSVGGLALLAGGFEAVKAAIDIGKEAASYQQKMLLIQTSAGASADEVKRMSAAVLSMSGPLATSPDKLADALYHVEQNGLRGKAALQALTIGAEGAKIGMADVEDTTNTMTIAMASGITGVQNLQQAMGFMIATVGTGDMRLKDLNEALSGGILSVAKGFGASLQDVAAVLATLGDNGIRGTLAAQALRQTMMGFAQPAKGGAEALREVGLSLTDLRDAMEKHGLVYAMNDLEQHMKSAGVTGSQVGAFITEAFGKRAGAGVGVLMGEIDRLNIKYAEAEKGANTFAARWQATTQSTKFQFQQLGASAQAAGIRILTDLLPGATAVGSALLAIGKLGAGALSGLLPIVGELGSVLKVGGDGAMALAHALGPIEPEMKALATAAAVMWLAFKGYEIGMLALASLKGALLKIGDTAAATGARVLAFGTTVDEAGATAAIGWKGLLGPLALVGIGIATLTSVFGNNDAAAQQLKSDTASYLDVLKQSKGVIDSSVTSMQIQTLTTQGVYDAAKKYGLSMETVNQAAQGNKPAMDEVTAATRGNMQAIISVLGPIGEQSKALAVGTHQYKVQKAATDANTRAQAAVKDAIQKTTTSTQLGTDAAKQYATMAGLVVDKNGIVATSQATVNTAVDNVSRAYNTATESGDAYLAALDTFSKSAGTANDRATIIGATLKANAGDALSFASALNGAATATAQLGTDIASAAKSVGKNGESTSALLASIVNLKTGTIDYSKTAAAPLISDLQSIQTSALSAAQATYQHNVRMEGGKKAADDAVAGYTGVERSLEAQLVKLGMTSTQAQKLTDKYLGVPKNVKTLIEQEGADPVVNVLNKIGTQLAILTGHPWDAKVTVDTSGALSNILGLQNALNHLSNSGAAGVSVNNARRMLGYASGGIVNGPGTGTSDTAGIFALSNGEAVIPAKAVAAHRATVAHLINEGRGLSSGAIVSASATSGSGGSPAVAPVVYVQNPFTGEYLLAQVSSAATGVLRRQAREAALVGGRA